MATYKYLSWLFLIPTHLGEIVLMHLHLHQKFFEVPKIFRHIMKHEEISSKKAG